MSRIIPISGKDMCRILEKLGFEKVHQVGSHIRYMHVDGRRTVVPVHGNEDLSIGLVKEIMRQAGISREDFERLR